jgi:uncharacterized membrane protein (DUF4010 family)
MHMNAAPMRLLVALGVGLLLGLERERRKGEGPDRAASGIRTFALTGLLGGVLAAIGNPLLVAAGAAIVATAALVAYARGDRTDPGITTEIALVVTYALGVLALSDPGLAGAASVSATAVLAFRTRLHSLARDALSQQEVLDGLLLAVAAVVVLPILPDRLVGPFAAINPAQVWRLVVLVMAVGIAGHLGMRFFGSRFGIPLAGLAGGLVSNTATMASMGTLARREPRLMAAAASGAVLGSFASLAQLSLVVGAADLRVLQALRGPLIAAGAVAAAAAIALSVHSLHAQLPAERPPVRGVDLTSALAFAGLVTATLIAVAGLHRWLGERGVLVGAVVGGAADVHAAAISTASLATRGELAPRSAVLPILGALSANTAVKMFIAFAAGPRGFFARVGTTLALLLGAAWAGAIF